MANQLGKFSPNVAMITQPLWVLLHKNCTWLWDKPKKIPFHQLKLELTRPVTLAHYDPLVEVKVSVDASSFGLSAVLLQKDAGMWKPISCLCLKEPVRYRASVCTN